MNIPYLYDRDTVGTWYEPRTEEFYRLGQDSAISPSSKDKTRVLVLNIDNQCDFDLPGWALPVPGAVQDAVRFIEWAYKNLNHITRFLNTFDKHPRFAIYHPLWWMNKEGMHPAPFTEISSDDIAQGVWIPTTDIDWSRLYVELLEKGGKKKLTIWPEHCIKETRGQRLLPAIQEMEAFHSGARGILQLSLDKGTVAQVEHYGAVRAEVEYPGNLEASGTNYLLLENLASYDKIFVIGQAKTHCVPETLDQIVTGRPEIAQKLYFLTDCSSSIPGYEAETERKFNALKAIGLHLITTNDNIF